MGKYKLPIYVIGTSHALVFREEETLLIPFKTSDPDPSNSGRFMILGTSAYLAYNVSDKNHQARQIVFNHLKKIPKKHLIILCYGAIDCMNHLIRQSVYQNRRISDITYECAEKYYNFAIDIANEDYEVALLSAEPQSIYHYADLDNTTTKIHSTVGPCDIRNIVTKYFNDCLKNKCLIDNKIKFIDVFKYFVDENMQTKHEYMIDPIHLNYNAFKVIEKELINMGIL